MDEWELYEPHHRARMAFRPGLTGMWQVSGRSNITDFEEVVKLDEPYYPVNDLKNGLLYSEYKKLADAENKLIFGGRLGEYKYYDMDQVIAAVLERCNKELH